MLTLMVLYTLLTIESRIVLDGATMKEILLVEVLFLSTKIDAKQHLTIMFQTMQKLINLNEYMQ